MPGREAAAPSNSVSGQSQDPLSPDFCLLLQATSSSQELLSPPQWPPGPSLPLCLYNCLSPCLSLSLSISVSLSISITVSPSLSVSLHSVSASLCASLPPLLGSSPVGAEEFCFLSEWGVSENDLGGRAGGPLPCQGLSPTRLMCLGCAKRVSSGGPPVPAGHVALPGLLVCSHHQSGAKLGPGVEKQGSREQRGGSRSGRPTKHL